MKELKIVVLCGGLSTERNISFLTGAKVCRALRSLGHRAVLADMYLGFEESNYGALRRAPESQASAAKTRCKEEPISRNGNCAFAPDKNDAKASFIEEDTEGQAAGVFDPEALFEALPPIPDYSFDGQAPDLEAVRRSRKQKDPSLFGAHVLELCQAADIVFVALHGKNGEDGRVQAVFDMLGIPYTGSGHLGSAMAMDKMITKQLAAGRGVRTPAFRRWDFAEAYPVREDSTGEAATGEAAEEAAAGCTAESGLRPHFRLQEADSAREAKETFIRSVCRQTDVPCVVKTPDGGSSVGVYIVQRKEDLENAVRGCLSYGDVFMTEQYISGREFTCGVLCGRALPSVEIVPKTRFYDYSSKYAVGATEEICPGRCRPEIEKEIGRTALKVHEIMGLSTYSRCDFMIDEEERVWFIEVNPLPGMTDTSLVPQEAAAVGIGYEELCGKIVEDGLRLRGRRGEQENTL